MFGWRKRSDAEPAGAPVVPLRHEIALAAKRAEHERRVAFAREQGAQTRRDIAQLSQRTRAAIPAYCPPAPAFTYRNTATPKPRKDRRRKAAWSYGDPAHGICIARRKRTYLRCSRYAVGARGLCYKHHDKFKRGKKIIVHDTGVRLGK